jgi:hypothetical protein
VALQPTELRRASALTGAGIVAFVLDTTVGAAPLLVLDVGYVLQQQHRMKQAS